MAEERKRLYEDSHENFEITHTDEYKAYMKALCRYASGWISPIRVKIAERAFEKYADPTIRRLVLAYGEECDKLDESRLFDFKMVSEYGAVTAGHLEDSCLNRAGGYGKAIWLLFDLDDDKKKEVG